MALTVAVTGPTGEIGLPLIAELEADPAVGLCGGWRGGVSTRAPRVGRRSSTGAVTFLIAVRWRRSSTASTLLSTSLSRSSGREETRRVNLEGSRNVFEVAIAAGVQRLVYASSVAAYGFHPDNPQPLTEDVPVRGSESFYYSAQKAELEARWTRLLAGSGVDAYVFRPCIVAGPRATMLIEKVVEGARLGDPLPALRRGLGRLPLPRPVLPDPGAPLQLVHHDDVARALAAAIAGRGEPGAYNLAGEGELASATSPGRWAGAPFRSPGRRRPRRRGRQPAQLPLAPAGVGDGAAHAGSDGHRQGPPGARLGAALRRSPRPCSRPRSRPAKPVCSTKANLVQKL